MTIRDQAELNYNRRLDKLVESGATDRDGNVITAERAQILRDRYHEASDAERTDMWDDLNDDFPASDPEYGSPIH